MCIKGNFIKPRDEPTAMFWIIVLSEKKSSAI